MVDDNVVDDEVVDVDLVNGAVDAVVIGRTVAWVPAIARMDRTAIAEKGTPMTLMNLFLKRDRDDVARRSMKNLKIVREVGSRLVTASRADGVGVR